MPCGQFLGGRMPPQTEADKALSGELGRQHRREQFIRRRLRSYEMKLLTHASRHQNPAHPGPEELDYYLDCLRHDLILWAQAERDDLTSDELALNIHREDRKRRLP